MTRREALALLLLGACGGTSRPPSPATPPEPSLALGSAVDLLPAAGLTWGVDARMRELLASPALIEGVAAVVPPERFDAFARRHGGVDLRSAEELALGGYADTVLSVVRAVVDPARVEGAFVARAVSVEGRAVESGIVRTWGTVGAAHEQLAVFGRQAVALEQGRFGPLRAAEYFARGKLRRALPALHAEPLASAVALLGDAPLRAFAPGPFEGPWAKGLGGLLRAATAMAGSATPVDQAPHGALAVHLVLTGAWGDDAGAAAERLRASFELLASDSLGRLLGLDEPIGTPRARGEPAALHLEMTLDPLRLGRGLHATTGGTLDDVLRL